MRLTQSTQSFSPLLATFKKLSLNEDSREAFADFYIADLLVHLAATMIAQYIAIGIAKSFAGLNDAEPIKFAEGFGFLDRPTSLQKAVVLKPVQSALLVSGVLSVYSRSARPHRQQQGQQRCDDALQPRQRTQH